MIFKRINIAIFSLGIAATMITFVPSKVKASCDPKTRTCFQPQASYTNWKFVGIKGNATPENCIAVYKRHKRFYSNGWQNTEEYKQQRCSNSGTDTPNQAGVSTSQWRFSSIKPNSTPESCTAIYVRDFKYYQNGYKSIQQKKEGQCGPGAIQQLVNERETKKIELYQECANKIKYNPNKLSYYKDEIVAKVCPASVIKGRYDSELYESERLKSIERFNAEQKIRDQEAAKKRAIEKRAIEKREREKLLPGAENCQLVRDPNQTASQRNNSIKMCNCMYVYRIAGHDMSDQEIVRECFDIVKRSL